MNPRKFFVGRAIGLLIVAVVALIYFVVFHQPSDMKEGVVVDDQPSDQVDGEADAQASDHKSASYMIEGSVVQLVDGYSESEVVPESVSKVITRYFGNELVTDLDGDGDDDVAFIVTQETGGSGVFYYAVAALDTDKGYVGSDGYLLGDRIAPQSTDVSPNPRHKNVVVFNYADRERDEPMSTPPSVGKSVYLKLVPESVRWGIVEPDFEGESAL